MLAFPDCQMLDVTGPLQMFAGVNDELGRQAYTKGSRRKDCMSIRSTTQKDPEALSTSASQPTP
jgi:hypothetical protein